MRRCSNHFKLTSNRCAFPRPRAQRTDSAFRECRTLCTIHSSRPPPSRCLYIQSTRRKESSSASRGSQGAKEDTPGQSRDQKVYNANNWVKKDEKKKWKPSERPKREEHEPEYWVRRLTKLLPAQLGGSSVATSVPLFHREEICMKVLAVLDDASSNMSKNVLEKRHQSDMGSDLLAYLGLGLGHWHAAFGIVDLLLQNVAGKVTVHPENIELSNLSWPSSISLHELCKRPFSVEVKERATQFNAADWGKHVLDPRYRDVAHVSESQDRTMPQIWQTLGYVIVEAAELEGDRADAAMRFVYRTIGLVHKLGLVPENVYSYIPSGYTSSVPRPPIMHLLSSRMLSTLSDAVWRAHQDEVIEKAINSGISYKDLGTNPPGGRFRLKVRPLGPETWLEFVLWCCAEGGFAAVGTAIIMHLQQQTENPWFAMNWVLPDGDTSIDFSRQAAAIDWDRVKYRHGGPVGQREGYSYEKPFAVMNPRTVSAEVVLALVESSMNTASVGLVKRGKPLPKVLRSVKRLIGFLEPHRLPIGYFDLLAVRLIQSGSIDPDRAPQDLQQCTEMLLYFRSLEAVHTPSHSKVSFDLETIQTHSELLNGLHHQSLGAFVEFGDVRRALEVFAQTQNLVDSSKLRSIGAFLDTSSQPSHGSASSKAATLNDAFNVSHGQMPPYKLAAFLDLLTDSKLVRLGNWLLYSEDIDGPLIPESSYGLNCLASPLVRFAAVSRDEVLVEKVQATWGRKRQYLSLELIGTLANTDAAFSRWTGVHKWLDASKNSRARNRRSMDLASLAGGILSLEIRMTQSATARATEASQALSRHQFRTAQLVLERLLRGAYDKNVGIFRSTETALVDRQIGSILRIFAAIPDTSLFDAAVSWSSRYRSGNGISLSTWDFNVLLAAIVETKGSRVGRMIWDLFCEDPREVFTMNRAYNLDNTLVPGATENDEGDWDQAQFFRTAEDRPSRVMPSNALPVMENDEVPFIESKTEKRAVANALAVSDQVPRAGYTKQIEKSEQSEEAVDQGDWDLADPNIRFDSEHDFVNLITPLAVSASDSSTVDADRSSTVAATTDPVVVPNLRTLRIIVRGALTERSTRQARGEDISEPQETLDWAKQFFRAFGLRRGDIEQEIQQRLDEDGDLAITRASLAEELRLYYKKKRTKYNKSKRKELIRVDVAQMFNSYMQQTRVTGLVPEVR